MVDWSQLLLPALVGAVLVFIASSIIHMVLQLHGPSLKKLSNEDEVRDTINKGTPVPGQYILPHCTDMKDGESPEMKAKFEEGPVALVYIRANGQMKIGPFLSKWFAYTLVTGIVAGYVARTMLPAGADYLSVFQVVGVASWLAYGWSGIADSIWVGKPWGATLAYLRDALIYAALTAGAFAWLWPES